MRNTKDQDLRHGCIMQPDGSRSSISRWGTIRWYNKLGYYHKETGPALIYSDGELDWFLNGTKYSFSDWIKRTPTTDEQKLLLRLQYA
jgi:hypothetical protein